MLSNEDTVEVHKTSSYHGIGLIDTPNETLNRMTDKEPIKKKKEPLDKTSMVERIIEKNSGDYNRKTLYEKFFEKISSREFNDIIEKLRESGKIAIDREGMVCWVWNPELAKKIQTDKEFAAKWTH